MWCPEQIAYAMCRDAELSRRSSILPSGRMSDSCSTDVRLMPLIAAGQTTSASLERGELRPRFLDLSDQLLPVLELWLNFHKHLEFEGCQDVPAEEHCTRLNHLLFVPTVHKATGHEGAKLIVGELDVDL